MLSTVSVMQDEAQVTVDELSAMCANEFRDIGQQFREVYRRFDKLETRFDGLESRFGKLETKFDKIISLLK